MKARIRKTKVGVRTYYYPQLQRHLLFIPFWESLGSVYIDHPSVGWYKSLGTFDEAYSTLMKYEELFGIKLNIINENK